MTSPDAPGFRIRAALPEDESQLLALSVHLNSVNLPADRDAIRGLLDASERSFAATLEPIAKRRYLFVLEDLERGALIGTSSIVTQLGQLHAPYTYFAVSSEEKYSRDLKLHFEHATLTIGFSYDGPTELAGLVVDPCYRRHPGRLGLAISYIRFLFIAARRQLFRDELLAELLPPLEPDGTSHLWDALGKRFTGMTYREADRLSHENKDFIRDLFPSGVVYATLLSPEARAVIGEVGQQTRGVEKMLVRVGFRYADRIDPFDGGPHFVADTDEVSVIRRYREAKVRVAEEKPGERALVAVLSEEPPYCRAVSTTVTWGSEIVLSEHAASELAVKDGDVVHVVPIP